MEHSDSSVLLAWIALGQASPVVALGLVCVVCAALVAVVIGGIGAFSSIAEVTSPRTKGVRIGLSIFALACGGYALKLMLGGMNIDGFELFKAIGLYTLTMAFFVGAQYAGSESYNAVSESRANETYSFKSQRSHKKAA